MEFIFFLLIIALLGSSSGNRDAERISQGLLGGVLLAFLAFALLVVLALGFDFFPTTTLWLLYTGAAVASALLVRGIYKRFFSAQARTRAAYKAMDKRWYDLSAHVVRLEMGKYSTDDLAWALEKGERILQRCRREHDRYIKLPPEPEQWKAQFYVDDIQRLENRLRAVAQKRAEAGACRKE